MTKNTGGGWQLAGGERIKHLEIKFFSDSRFCNISWSKWVHLWYWSCDSLYKRSDVLSAHWIILQSCWITRSTGLTQTLRNSCSSLLLC